MAEPSYQAVESGIRNLLLNCAGLRAGQSILFVAESGPAPYFQPGLCEEVAGIARGMGFHADVLTEAPVADATDFPASVRRGMQAADLTVFFSRLGDQVRFVSAPGQERAVMTYTLTRRHLGHPFATARYAALERVHDALLTLILSCERFTITADCGTDLTGRLRRDRDGAVAGFTVRQFPVMIFPPVLCDDLEGQLAIRHFVTSSSTRAYDDSVLMMDAPVLARVSASRMVAFEGPPELVARLRDQLARAAALTGGDPLKINSWHTGINPNTFYDTDPYGDVERWGTVAFGSPRYTHFHAAGHNPGDAAFHLMDATIHFDDHMVWDRGRFVFLDRPEIRALVPDEHRAELNADVRQSIGL
ncbi:MAG: hypothetical protein NXH82_03245 [Rhodobacteraceae bacterium]|nr:hypothetical protein [Paracoccaceae bacterium]